MYFLLMHTRCPQPFICVACDAVAGGGSIQAHHWPSYQPPTPMAEAAMALGVGSVFDNTNELACAGVPKFWEGRVIVRLAHE